MVASDGKYEFIVLTSGSELRICAKKPASAANMIRAVISKIFFTLKLYHFHTSFWLLKSSEVKKAKGDASFVLLIAIELAED